MTVHKDLVEFSDEDVIRVKRSGVYPGGCDHDEKRLGILRIETITDHPTMTIRVNEALAIGTAAQMLALLYKRYPQEIIDQLVANAVAELQASFSEVEN